MGKIEAREYELKNGGKILVRSVEPDESKAVRLFSQTILSSSEFFVTLPEERKPTKEETSEWIAGHLDDPRRLLLAAIADGTIIGLANIDTEPRKRLTHVATLHMGILKEWRGMGVGTVLIRAIIEWAKANPPLEKICLSVFSNNNHAIHLYEKIGFIEEGRRKKQYKTGPEEYVDEILMGRFVK